MRNNDEEFNRIFNFGGAKFLGEMLHNVSAITNFSIDTYSNIQPSLKENIDFMFKPINEFSANIISALPIMEVAIPKIIFPTLNLLDSNLTKSLINLAHLSSELTSLHFENYKMISSILAEQMKPYNMGNIFTEHVNSPFKDMTVFAKSIELQNTLKILADFSFTFGEYLKNIYEVISLPVILTNYQTNLFLKENECSNFDSEKLSDFSINDISTNAPPFSNDFKSSQENTKYVLNNNIYENPPKKSFRITRETIYFVISTTIGIASLILSILTFVKG